jgi:hypothetical protein
MRLFSSIKRATRTPSPKLILRSSTPFRFFGSFINVVAKFHVLNIFDPAATALPQDHLLFAFNITNPPAPTPPPAAA